MQPDLELIILHGAIVNITVEL